MGPAYKVAELLKISFKASIAYCEEVRSISGLGHELPYKKIARTLAEHVQEVPSARRLAEILTGGKLPPVPLKKAEPKKVVKRAVTLSPAKRPVRSPGRKSSKKRFEYERPVPPPSYIKRGSYFDDQRVSEEKLEHCPHGVPHGRVCAICDPEKFREQTGMD